VDRDAQPRLHAASATVAGAAASATRASSA
jgi:hypothetical protein